VYIGPGTYREVVTVAMTSAVAETSVLGDPGNAQGFKTAAGVLVSPAEVIWTAYTTNDTTTPSASSTVDLAGRDFLTFQFMTLISGTTFIVDARTQTSTNLTFRDCTFNCWGVGITADGAFGTQLSWLIERCLFLGQGTANTGIILFANDTGAGADYDMNVTIRNCTFIKTTNYLVEVNGSGGLANKPGGVYVYNCSLFGGRGCSTAVGCSTTIPVQIRNSTFFCGGQSGLAANILGQVIEDYNLIVSATTHTNVTQGANTVTGSDRSPNWQMGQERLYGYTPRMFMEPKVGSWMLTFGNDGTYTTAEDFLGLPRPGGGASATKGIGYLGRGNTFTKETGTVRTGTNAMSITGPGTQDFQLPVDATSTTATVYVRWDATYAGTKPLMKVLNGGECGVTDATATATGASGSWEAISLNFTPARTGIVTIRLQSSDTNGAGVMYADDFSVV